VWGRCTAQQVEVSNGKGRKGVDDGFREGMYSHGASVAIVK